MLMENRLSDLYNTEDMIGIPNSSVVYQIQPLPALCQVNRLFAIVKTLLFLQTLVEDPPNNASTEKESEELTYPLQNNKTETSSYRVTP